MCSGKPVVGSCVCVAYKIKLLIFSCFRVVANFIECTNNKINNSLKYICYDDACHSLELKESPKDKFFVIDRFPVKKEVSNSIQL